MTPLRRLSDFFSSKTDVVGEQANKQVGIAGTRIVAVAIEGRITDAGGTGYVIRGKLLRTTGLQTFQVGEVVNVLFKRDEPIVILGHTWRKAQFEEPSIRAPAFGTLEILSGASIELPPKIDPLTGLPEVDESGAPVPQFTFKFVLFTGAGQFVIDPEFPALNEPPDVDEFGEQIDPEAPPGDILSPRSAFWGDNGNHLLLLFEILDDPEVPTSEREFIQAFKINRSVNSTKVPLKKDPADETKLLRVGDIPVVDGELVGNRIPLFDRRIPLRREAFVGTEPQKLKAKENLIFRTFHDIEAFSEAAEDGSFQTALKELPGLWDSRTTEVAAFEEEHDMLLSGEEVGIGAYTSRLIATFLDRDNEIIQIYNIAWNIGNFFSAFDEENRKRVTLFAPSTPDDVMPTVSELLTAAGFLQPVGPGEPLDLPDLIQGQAIVGLGSGGGFSPVVGPHADAAGFDLASIFFEPFAFLQVIPAIGLFRRFGAIAVGQSHFDVFALKRDTSQVAVRFEPCCTGPDWDPNEDKSVIVGASFEEEVSLEYDREVDMPMGARMFVDPGEPNPNVPGGHRDGLIFTRPGFGVSQSPLGRSFVNDGTGQNNLLNFRGASQSGGNGPFYRTDDFGGGCCPGPITVGADGVEDQVGILDPGPPPQRFPQAFPQTFETAHNIKFNGRFKFGDPELRPELPDVVKETKTVRRALGFLSTQINLLSAFEFFTFPGPGKITTPDSDVDIDTFFLEFFEEHEPSFTSFGFEPITNKKAVLMVGTSRFGEDPEQPTNLPEKTRILRWDYSNEDDEFFIDSPTQPFEERGPSIDPLVIGVSNMIAHDGAIYLRWQGILSGGALPAERIFIPARAGEPESAGDRIFTVGKRPGDVIQGFQFIKPGRGKPGQVQQSYADSGGRRSFISQDKDVRDRIFRITVNEGDGKAETVKTTAPPNSDVRRLNPKVIPFSFQPDNRASYHYAGIK